MAESEIKGDLMNLTGLSAHTLAQIQTLLANRIDVIQRRNNGMPEPKDGLEVEALSEAYKQVNAAWFNRISWTNRKSVKW